MDKTDKLLIHHCCAPCSPEILRALGKVYDITSLWFNPNIYPQNEHDLRKRSLADYIGSLGIELKSGPQVSEEFIKTHRSLPESERCEFCYTYRLNYAADEAIKNSIKIFTTTLLVSPYQKHELLKAIGLKIAEQKNLQFKYIDLRSRYYEGKKLAKELGAYLQKYCGCAYSLEEREKSALKTGKKI
jgi:epoxyqueuosine reductase